MKLKRILNKITIFKKKELIMNEACSEFEVNNWILSKFIVKKIIPIVGVSPFPLSELLLMTAAIVRTQPTHIIEWGTHIGKSARIFYETSRRFSPESKVHSIDLPDNVAHIEHPGSNRGKLVRKIKAVTLHQGDGLDTSILILKEAETRANKGNSMLQINPLFFLDGDHSYESIIRELEGIYSHYPQSHFLIHDAFFQSAESNYNIGPYSAIQYFLKDKSDVYQVLSTDTGRPGMTLLWKK